MPDHREQVDKRLTLCLYSMSLLFVFLLFSLYFFQVFKTDKYVELASENRLRILRLPADRGEIFDRNGVPLALDVHSFSIMGYPLDIRTHDLIPQVKDVFVDHGLPLSELQIEKSINQQFLVPYRAVTLVSDLTLSQMTDIISDPRFPKQLFPMQVSRRTYPAGAMVSHILGYVSEINQKELVDIEGNYRGGDIIGKDGVEKAYEDVLKGSPGKQALEVDARGRKVQTLEFTPPVPGNDLELTIDLGAQMLVARHFENFKGAAVAVDVTNGDVLVLYSSPAYDNNPMARGISPEEWRLLSVNRDRPLMNRAISGLYPPGSVFKPVVALAALEEKTADTRTSYYCNGSFTLGNRKFRCWKKYGHGNVNMISAIKDSCDVYFYQVGLKTGIDVLSDWATSFGIGEKTGINLTGEKGGNIIDRKWKRKNIGEKWYPGDTVNYSIGQGFLLMTPLQIVRMYAALANGGRMLVPRLVGNETDSRKIEMTGSNQEIVREALERVVEDGTATYAGEFGVSIAGKTGTCQNPHGPDHALFAGYAPVNNPRYAVAIVLEAGEHGGSVASPVGGELLAYLVKHGRN